MYAIVKTGGKQYRVAVGDILDVELLDSEAGNTVEFKEVLFAYDGSKNHVHPSNLANFPVLAEVLGKVNGKKVTSLKYKASHTQCRKWGHRQKYTRVKITAIGKNHQNENQGE